MKLRSFLLILFFNALFSPSFAQIDSTFLNHTERSLSGYFKARPVEKVYLHLNKSYYLPGDTIWFKAYTVVGELHQLSALSGVLYCELINGKDSLINRHILKLAAGIAWSDFVLPHSLKPGIYNIRAYTNWMRNAGTDYFYNQQIRIGGTLVRSNTEKQVIGAKPDIQFFPEGGELVNGVRSRVAVKSVGINGLGANITGSITDNEGNEVAAFTTQHLGMGVFALIPQAGQAYKAKITCADSSKYTIDLPKAKDEGFTLAINNNGADSVYVKVAANDKLFQQKQGSMFYLVAQSGGKIYYTAEAKLASPVFTTRIPKTRFPSGIVQFTLFSQSGEPMNERIIFIRNNDFKVTLSSSAQTYAPRQKVKIDVGTKNGDTPVVTGSFSAAVINESRVPADENEESTILNNLLLTSDIKGYIERPNYYFINTDDQTRSDLDVLMLTQGYRRFEWNQVMNNTRPAVTYQPEESLELAGTLKTLSGKSAPNGKITMLATKESFIADTTTDLNGNFRFIGLDLSDTAKIVLRARKENNGANVAINVNVKNYPEIIKQKGSDITVNLSPTITDIMQKNNADYQMLLKEDSLKNSRHLKEVNIRATKINKKPELIHSDNLNGPGNADQVIMGDKITNCVTVSDCLQGRVFGVTFGSDGTPHSIRAQGRLGGSPAMVVIVDGNILPGSSLNNLNANDIYSIEVLRSGAYLSIYGSSAPGGALVITTRRGGDPNYTANMTPSGLITYSFKGFYKAKTFYSPKYTHPKTDTEPLDLRSAIYWKPNIITDKDGNASFEYFNADAKGTYRVVVEGIDDNGNLGRQVYRYKVE